MITVASAVKALRNLVGYMRAFGSSWQAYSYFGPELPGSWRLGSCQVFHLCQEPS